MIDQQILRLNQSLGFPTSPWVKAEVGVPNPTSGQRMEAQIGHIMVEKGLNGYLIHQIVNIGGGVRTIGPERRMTASEVHSVLRTANAIAGIALAGQGAKSFNWSI